MHVLVTGAAGRVGLALRKELAAAGHRLRLVDVRPFEAKEGKVVVADVGDPAVIRRLMKGIEAVAHLAYGRIAHQEPGDIVRGYDVNTRATHLLLWEAARVGAKRFVYTSSLSVFGWNDQVMRGTLLDERAVAHPSDSYGLTKLLGEEACRYCARVCEMDVIVLRLCYVRNSEEWKWVCKFKPRTRCQRRGRAMATHVDDVARAIHLALTVPHKGFELLHVAANNPGRVTAISRARRVLGFWPRRRVDEAERGGRGD